MLNHMKGIELIRLSFGPHGDHGNQRNGILIDIIFYIIQITLI